MSASASLYSCKGESLDSPEETWNHDKMSKNDRYTNEIQRIAKGAGKKVPRENCRKVSKNFLTLFDDF